MRTTRVASKTTAASGATRVARRLLALALLALVPLLPACGQRPAGTDRPVSLEPAAPSGVPIPGWPGVIAGSPPAGWALVNVEVANLMEVPRSSAPGEVATQAILGTPLALQRQDGAWYLARTPEGYEGWIADTDVVPLLSLSSLVNGSRWAAISVAEASLRDRPQGKQEQGEEVARAVMGTLLPVAERTTHRRLPGWVGVNLPDGREAWVLLDDVRIYGSAAAVAAERRPAEEIIALARQFMGVPYVWGGTTPLGFDCSGFTQFAFRLNGYTIPRDADQQYEVGTAIERQEDLRPGDLVFFETYAPGPSHVGIYIGDGQYINARRPGVSIDSFRPDSPQYNASLAARYIGARRIIEP